MALVLKCGGIFLHVPKTGGEWVRLILQELNLADYELGDKHADMDEVLYYAKFRSGRQFLLYVLRRKILRKVRMRPEEGFFKFCFVRHPLKWYESYWKFCSALGWPRWGEECDVARYHINAELNDCADDDFNGFVRKVVKKHPGYVTELYGRYTRCADFVGKQETLANDLLFVLQQLGIDVDAGFIQRFKPINVSPKSQLLGTKT